jgi:predicted nucleic acid-binding protein
LRLPVRLWIANPPAWVEISDSPTATADSSLSELGAGETEAIFLASEFDGAILLMDDRRGVAAALLRGLTVIGTMGLLARAAKHGLFDLTAAFDKLKQTNFRYRQDIMDLLLIEAIAKEIGD